MKQNGCHFLLLHRRTLLLDMIAHVNVAKLLVELRIHKVNKILEKNVIHIKCWNILYMV